MDFEVVMTLIIRWLFVEIASGKEKEFCLLEKLCLILHKI
jgi:hypothetical protein